jgi:hypothetical protein
MRPGIDVSDLFGKVREVNVAADYKVRVVGVGEDLRVRSVSAAARAPGQWQMSTSGEASPSSSSTWARTSRSAT